MCVKILTVEAVMSIHYFIAKKNNKQAVQILATLCMVQYTMSNTGQPSAFSCCNISLYCKFINVCEGFIW